MTKNQRMFTVAIVKRIDSVETVYAEVEAENKEQAKEIAEADINNLFYSNREFDGYYEETRGNLSIEEIEESQYQY